MNSFAIPDPALCEHSLRAPGDLGTREDPAALDHIREAHPTWIS